MKYVIVIGSGFHKESHGKDVFNYLTHWDQLLKCIGWDPLRGLSKNYILDFELLVAKETRNQTDKIASKIEANLLKKLSKKNQKDQNIVFSKNDIKYPSEIFNPSKVSDVISLNFDLVPELLITNGKIPAANYCKSSMIKDGEKGNKKNDITRHRVIGNKKEGKITFWHPHGDIIKPASIQLGIRKYGTSIDEVEVLRKRFKQSEKNTFKNSNDYIESWYEKIMKQPFIIIGASMSDNEWDLWFALINKIRNFSKGDNNQNESKIFKMRCNGEKYESDIFTELISNSQDITKQWQYVKDLLS